MERDPLLRSYTVMDVLIVERDEFVAGVIADGLADDGITANVVSDEQTALAIPTEEMPSVVITGKNRDGEDTKGLIIARTLRERWPALGVIFIAALWPVRLCRGALSERDRFLTKPVGLACMTRTVRDLIKAGPPPLIQAVTIILPIKRLLA